MRRASKLDLALGVLLGVVLGLAVTYALVMGIGNSKDSSTISPTAPAKSGEARKGIPREGAPAQPVRRR